MALEIYGVGSKKLCFVLLFLCILLTKVSPALSFQLGNRIVNLRELYREHKRDSDDSNTSGNFLRASDGTVLFFASESREKFRQIVAGSLPETVEKFVVSAKPYSTQKTKQFTVTKLSDALRIGPFSVEQSELERVRLTGGWSEVIQFCNNYVVDDSGAHLRLVGTSITRLNQNEFLICGGYSFRGYKITASYNSPAKLAQIFDVSAGRVVKVFQLAANHCGNRSILLPDGKVLITGCDLSGPVDPTLLELVDPANSTSKLLHSKLKFPKSGSTVCLDFVGRCLIFPGNTKALKQVNVIERVDPVNDKVEVVGSMMTPRWYPKNLNEVPQNALMLTKERVLVSGGSACSVYAEGMFQRHDAEFVKIDSSD